MIDLMSMTKKELLDLAKEHEVTGRHDMTKEELYTALSDLLFDEVADEEDKDLGEEPEGEFITKEQLVELKRRRQSGAERDVAGKVIRHGRNLSGNTPYRRKYYYLPAEFATLQGEYKEAVEAAPMQVQLILKAMRELSIDEDNAMIGGDIVGMAINKGFLKTKIAPENLFAYYRRLLEALGVRVFEEVD